MKTMIFALALTACATTPAPSQAQPTSATTCTGGDAASCRYILAATADLATTLTTADPAPLRRHLDPQALWISATGAVRTGAAFITFVTRDTRRATATLDSADVHVFGDSAIVIWTESWTAPAARVKAGRLSGIDTWAKRNGYWRIIATTETR